MFRASAFVGFISNKAFFIADPDTLIKNPSADVMSFEAGGVEFVRLIESTQDELAINEAGVDIDTRIEASGAANAFFLQGSDGFIGINTAAPAARMDILSGTSLVPALLLSDIATNAARKRAAFAGRHYTNAEEPHNVVELDSVDGTSNAIIGYGGPNGSYNGVTHHRFYTAASATTLGGTLRVELTNTLLAINGAAEDYDFRVGSDTSSGVFGTDGAGAGFAYFAPDPNGARMRVKCKSELLSAVSGATVVTTTGIIPAGVKYLGVTTRVVTELGGTVTGYTSGDGSDADRWGTVTGVIVGTVTEVPTADPSGFTAAAAEVTLTALTANFNGTGAIRVTVHYRDFAGPTS